MKILVTGAAGFVGSHLAERLLNDGHDVVGLDAFIPYYPRDLKERNLEAARSYSAFSFMELDLRTDELDACLAGVEAVIHQAAMAGLMRSWEDLGLYLGCNVLGLHRLLEASLRASVRRFVHISTSSIYGVMATGDEEEPPRPASPYGITKLAAEHLVLAYVQRYGLPATILRYFSVYGPRQRPDMAYHIFIERLRRGEPITIFGDGEQTRSNTFISDCLDATVSALEHGEVGEAYNIGGGEVISLNQAISILAGLLDTRPTVAHQPARPGDQRHTAANIAKAERTLGYRPSVRPADGLREQVEWHLAALPPHAPTS